MLGLPPAWRCLALKRELAGEPARLRDSALRRAARGNTTLNSPRAVEAPAPRLPASLPTRPILPPLSETRAGSRVGLFLWEFLENNYQDLLGFLAFSKVLLGFLLGSCKETRLLGGPCRLWPGSQASRTDLGRDACQVQGRIVGIIRNSQDFLGFLNFY